MNDEILDRVCAIIAVQLDVEESRLTPDNRLVGDLGADDLDFVELVMELEEAFDITIPDDAVPIDGPAMKRVTVQTLVQAVTRELAGRPWQNTDDNDWSDTTSSDISDGYYECDVPPGDGLCSDNQCPCPDVEIPRGTGYLYISQENIALRRQYPGLQECREAIQQKVAEMREIVGPNVSGMFLSGPILVCKKGAKLRGLDLDVAATDARHWWKTGFVPLRPTPLSGDDPQPLPKTKKKGRKKSEEESATPELSPTAPLDDHYNHTNLLASGIALAQLLIFGIAIAWSFSGAGGPEVAEKTETIVNAGQESRATTFHESPKRTDVASDGSPTSTSSNQSGGSASSPGDVPNVDRALDLPSEQMTEKGDVDEGVAADGPGAEADRYDPGADAMPSAPVKPNSAGSDTMSSGLPADEMMTKSPFDDWGQLDAFPLSEETLSYRKVYPNGRIRPANVAKEEPYRFLAFRPGTNILLAYGNDSGLLRFQELVGQRRTVLVSGLPIAAGRGGFNVIGDQFIVGTVAGNVQSWDVNALSFKASSVPSEKRPIRCLTVSPTNLIVAANEFSEMGVCTINDLSFSNALPGDGTNCVGLAVSPENARIACVSSDRIRILSFSGELLNSLSGNFGYIAYAPNGILVAVDYTHKGIRTGPDTERSWEVAWDFSGPGDWTASALGPSGREVAIGTSSGEIRLYDLEEGVLLKTLNGHRGEVLDLAFTSDGERLASTSGDRTIRLWGRGGTTNEPSLSRTWSDTTGQHKTQARFVRIDSDHVVLEKGDGSQVRVPIERLSNEDRDWIRSRPEM